MNVYTCPSRGESPHSIDCPVTTPDPVTDVWELLFTAACDYRDADGQSEAGLIDALMPVVKAYGDARAAGALESAAADLLDSPGPGAWERLRTRAAAMRAEEAS